jgi:phosphoglycolate phosphatase-like HAD superfamily hydrolase
MNNAQEILKKLPVEHDFFIGIDSDGCVFDTMEVKHKECFCPAFVQIFELQSIAKYARETWEFVNLYSKTRGANRFIAIVEAMKLLKERPQIKARNIEIPNMSPVDEWITKENRLSNTTLEGYLKENNVPILDNAYKWSLKVNKNVEEIVFGVAPFPYVDEILNSASLKADIMVVSQTPTEALEREWKEHALDKNIRFIAGQEMGTKTEHLAYGAKGKYKSDKILMVGDAPGDFKAARANEAAFYPINPGHEEESWERLSKEALDRFFNGTYKGEYEQKLLNEFNACLPLNPPWQ